MLLRQGRRISTVLSVVKCSLAWRRRATPRLQTIYVANRGDSSLRERSPGTPRGVHPPRDSDEWSARMRLCETWDPRNEVRVEDEQGTWIRRAQDRSYDRALNQSRFVRSHASCEGRLWLETWSARRCPRNDPAPRRGGSSSTKCFYSVTNNRSYAKVPAAPRKRGSHLRRRTIICKCHCQTGW